MKSNIIFLLLFILTILPITSNADFYNRTQAVVEDRSVASDTRINMQHSPSLSPANNNYKLDQHPVQNPIIDTEAGPALTIEPASDSSVDPSIDPSETQQQDPKDLQRKLQELESMPIASRLKRIENVLEQQNNYNIDNRIKLLQFEIQNLRGSIEDKLHQMERNLVQQKVLYEDLDRRFSAVKSNNSQTLDQSNLNNKSYSLENGDIDQQRLYTNAYQKIKQRDYSKAIELFNKYIKDYPEGSFSANSNYWLGEIYMLQSNYTKAGAAFDIVTKKYPKSPKAADAMYKKGLVYLYQKDFKQAKFIFKDVIKQYNNTTAARSADKQLQSIEVINNEA